MYARCTNLIMKCSQFAEGMGGRCIVMGSALREGNGN